MRKNSPVRLIFSTSLGAALNGSSVGPPVARIRHLV